MLNNLKDMTGLVFGRLTVVERSPHRRPDKQASWVCVCQCGANVTVCGSALRVGDAKSCGCLRRDVTTALKTTHGLSRSYPSEYRTWAHLKARCLNPTDRQWPIYGGRGIRVCDRWLEFENFFADMGPKPHAKYSIDRIDVNGHYEPSNCRWADAKTQSNNTRSNHYIECNGVKRTLVEWSEAVGIKAGTIGYRVRAGWPVEKALTAKS